MSQVYLQHDEERAPCRCDDCGKITPFNELAIITDIEERVSPGYICPAGECGCGALAYLSEPGPDMAITRINTMKAALMLAESFMAGFEDDPMQEGINEKLAVVRGAIVGRQPRLDPYTLEKAREAYEAHDKAGRDWVLGSMWDKLNREGAARVAALVKMEGQ